MKGLEASSVDAIVTDPPYGLSFMGKHWDNPVMLGQKATGKEQRGAYAYGGSHSQGYFANDNGKYQGWCTDWAVEALRVAKPGAHLLAFGGTRTFHRLACAIEDAGWEIRDTIMWVYGSGFPKAHNLTGDWQGWGTALKPAWEPIIVARKPLQGTVAANVLKWGTGALNVDGCRVGTADGHGGGRKGSSGFCGDNYEHDGFVASSVGRWPANFIHDGSEEVLALFPETSVTGNRSARSKAAIVADTAWATENHQSTEYPGDSGSAARFFYCAKASKADRDEGLDGMEARRVAGAVGMQRVTARNWGDDSETVYERKTVARNHHPTVKPTALMRYLCRLVTPPDGVVLDPFMGSGSTGKAALQEGFRFVGIELEPEYLEIANGRITAAQPCLN